MLVDPSGRLAGRGAYLCAQTTCLDLAKKKRALDRALETSVPAELLEELATVTTDTSNMNQGGIHGQE